MKWFDRIRHAVARRKIFISYRRTDSGGYAALLRDELERRYRSKLLFLDHRDIDGGDEWKAVLATALAAADVVLVVIGPDWLTARDQNGELRLDDPADWVRREVEAALATPTKRVVPVLVGNADMPTATALPASMAELTGRQARVIRPDAFAADTRRLMRRIGGWRSRLAGLPVYVWPLAVIGTAAVTWLVYSLVTPAPNEPPDLPASVEITTAQGVPVEFDLLAGVTDENRSTVELRDAGPLSENGGRIAQVRDGTVRYTSPPDFHGDDVFRYQVVDEHGATSSGSVLVNVLIGPMVGDFNVAVVAFAHVAPDGSVTESTESRALSADIYRRIDQELSALRESEGYAFEVRGPDDIGAIHGASRSERATAAQDLAESIAADVVVYGTLTEDAIAPEFFVQARGQNLADAEELTGDYELGSRILGSALNTGSITDNAAVRRALLARARALTQFVIGLSFYGGRDYVSARDAFESADTVDWRDEDGKEILYMFLGNSAGMLHDFGTAAADFERALTLNPEFARAQLGLAEVEFFNAAIIGHNGTCAPGAVDTDGLARSETGYESALTARDRPTVSNIEAKVSYGLGRVYACQALGGAVGRADAARSAFAAVVDEYETGNETIREIAAESYAGLALLAYPSAETANVDTALCDVVAFYDEAIAITKNDERRELFSRNQAPARDELELRGSRCGGT